jgi:predicted transcriptional regulator
VPAQVYLDPDQWARFDAVARSQNRSRSAQLRELIQREVEAFEASLGEAA